MTSPITTQTKTGHEPYLTWLILGLSCVPFVLMQQNGLSVIDAWFMPDTWAGLLSPFGIVQLWSPIFVHYTVLHLATNLYLFWLFAQSIEQHSRVELLLLVLISAAVSNLVQYYMTGPNFGGLSGVVYALLSYRWLLYRQTKQARYQLDTILAIILLALIPLTASGLLGKFSDYAHLGGLLSGALLALCALRFGPQLKSKSLSLKH